MGLAQLSDALAELSTDVHPMVEALMIDACLGHGTTRIIIAKLFNKTPVARVLFIGNDDVIEGALLRASPGKSNLDHVVFLAPAEAGRLFFENGSEN